jgi:hypothetical protein
MLTTLLLAVLFSNPELAKDINPTVPTGVGAPALPRLLHLLDRSRRRPPASLSRGRDLATWGLTISEASVHADDARKKGDSC